MENLEYETSPRIEVYPREMRASFRQITDRSEFRGIRQDRIDLQALKSPRWWLTPTIGLRGRQRAKECEHGPFKKPVNCNGEYNSSASTLVPLKEAVNHIASKHGSQTQEAWVSDSKTLLFRIYDISWFLNGTGSIAAPIDRQVTRARVDRATDN